MSWPAVALLVGLSPAALGSTGGAPRGLDGAEDASVIRRRFTLATPAFLRWEPAVLRHRAALRQDGQFGLGPLRGRRTVLELAGPIGTWSVRTSFLASCASSSVGDCPLVSFASLDLSWHVNAVPQLEAFVRTRLTADPIDDRRRTGITTLSGVRLNLLALGLR